MKTPKAKKLPSGSWFVRVRINGQDVGITRPTEKEAVAEAMAVKAGIKKAAPSNSMKLSDAYARYIDAKEAVLSPSTVAGYRRLSQNTMQGLMATRLSDITNEKVQLEISKMVKAGKSPKYIRNAQGLLSAVLKMYQPEFSMNTYLPQKQKIGQRMISDDEITKIMDALKGDRVELPVLMALWMGMRMSEVLGAEYEDIKNQRLHICRAVVKDYDGKSVTKQPKSFAGDRTVAIPDYIYNLMQSTGRSTGRIVTASASTIYEHMETVLRRNGIQHCKFHDLRHANAAVMVRLGIQSKYAQERNGWNSDRMYTQVYSYVMQDEMRAVEKSIDSYFGNKIGNEILKT